MTDAEQFAAFQAWQASQSGNAAMTPRADETPEPTISQVLCALVRSARLADETTVFAYEKVINEYFGKSHVEDGTGTEA